MHKSKNNIEIWEHYLSTKVCTNMLCVEITLSQLDTYLPRYSPMIKISCITLIPFAWNLRWKNYLTFNFNQSHDIVYHYGTCREEREKKKKTLISAFTLDRLPGIPLNLFTSILNPSWHMDCITQCFRIGTKLYCLTSTRVWVEKKIFLRSNLVFYYTLD